MGRVNIIGRCTVHNN